MREVLAASSSLVFPTPAPTPTPTPTPSLHRHHSIPPSKSGPQPKSKIFRRNKRSLNANTQLLSPVRWDSTSDNGHLVKYYANLACTLAESGKLHALLSIAESSINSGVKPSQFASLLNVNLVSEGIRSMISAGNLENVIGMLSGFKKIGIEAIELFDELAIEALRQECRRTLLNCNDAQVIVSLMATVQGLEFPSKYLLRTSEVIRFCVNKQDSTAAIRYAQIFPQSQDLFCSILTEFGKKRDLVSALTVFEASKQNQDIPDMYAYRTIIDVCGLCGEYPKSRSIYEELRSSNFTPNIYVFNSVMNANASDLGYTLKVYKHMKKVGVTADLASYNILLKACCISGRVDHAKEIYNEVIGLEAAGVFKLDVFTYSTMIKVLADARMWKMALHIKEDMILRGVVPNAVTWSSLISACANAGLVEKAFHLFDDMLLAGCEPNSQCCNVLLHACVEARQYDRAFRLFYSWKKNGIPKADHIQNNNENYVLQHEPFTTRWPFIPTTSTYNILMTACGTDYFRAKAVMDEMKLEGLSPDEISWSILIDIVGSSKNGKGALQILRSMHQAGVQPDVVTYTTAIKVCVEHKDLKLAFSLFAEMKRYQIKPNPVTYNTLLRARRRYGSLQEVQQCLALYQDMRKAGYKPNDYYLKQLIEEWCEGVIQNSNEPKGGHFTCDCTTLRPESLLIQRVAERLQDSNAQSLSIDLRGLTKIEARIMVLAVLRMIKEKYSPGDSLKDDLLIILEAEDEESDMDEDSKHRRTTTTTTTTTAEAIVELLQRDLGLEMVLPRETRTESGGARNEEQVLIISSDPPSSNLKHSVSRRPTNVQRLKISKGSLMHWLLKRGNLSSAT